MVHSNQCIKYIAMYIHLQVLSIMFNRAYSQISVQMFWATIIYP